jgi:hypothetical protein
VADEKAKPDDENRNPLTEAFEFFRCTMCGTQVGDPRFRELLKKRQENPSAEIVGTCRDCGEGVHAWELREPPRR